MKVSLKNLIPYLIVLITFVSVNQWSSVPIGDKTTTLLISIITVFFIIRYTYLFFNQKNKYDYLIIVLYLSWVIWSAIRGAFIAENRVEWTWLIVGVLSLSLPLLVFYFSEPTNLSNTLRIWLKFALPAFILFFLWVTTTGSKHFYLGPIILLACFLPVFKLKWQIITLFLLAIMYFDFGARSQMIKATIVLLLSLVYYLRKFIPIKLIEYLHWVFYVAPLVLLFLGITGTFNVFQDFSDKNKGKIQGTHMRNGKMVKEDYAADTRTFIYTDVISSAIKHNYVLWGRTPARGNDSPIFGIYTARLYGGKWERHSNELLHTNVFTWLGVIGLLLYSLIYLRSSYLAVFKSNSFFLKIIGIFIALRFFYGWVEDFNDFDIANISLWMSISMGISEDFRKMKDEEFKGWVRGVFPF